MTTNTPAGDDKPTPKAIKEKLDKYRRNRDVSTDNAVTFSLGPKSGSATPSPRKSRTTKKPTPAGTDTGAGDDEEGTGSSAPVSGNGNGQGKARKEAEVCESPSKRIKTEDADPSPSLIPLSFEIRVPPPSSPVRLKTEDEHADHNPKIHCAGKGCGELGCGSCWGWDGEM